MSKPLIAAAAAATLLAGAAPALAQEGVDEIVVTGSRLSEYDPFETPHVTVVKRADNLITTVRVVCDTRDKAQRLSELKSTLRNMVRAAAKDGAVELGLGDEVVGRFDETMLDQVIRADGQKPDTSYAVLLVKTKVSAGDTFDAASGRLEKFVAGLEKVGRTEALLNGDWELTLIGPSRHRPEIVAAVAADARKTAAAFGDGYGVKVVGLEHPISWYQAGPLDLALYVPYKLEIAPVGR